MYNILIVEDDRTIAGAMKKHIDAWGFNARCAEDFRNIMEEFADFNPQLVLLDISLPFLMATIGAAKYARCPRCLSSLSHPHQTI